MPNVKAKSKIKYAEFSIKVIKKDGTVVDHGVVASTKLGNVKIHKNDSFFVKLYKKLSTILRRI